MNPNPIQLPSSIIRSLLLLAILAIAPASRAACGNAGAPCATDDAPAVQAATSAPSMGVGNPIHLATGNKYQREVDLPALPGMLGLEIVRHYNSTLSGPQHLPGPLGRGWRLSYETELAAYGNAIEITQADGSTLTFGRDLLDPQLARHADPARGTVGIASSARGEQYTWTWQDGRKLNFNAQGKLVQIQAPTGEILTLQHDANGLLARVTDPQGRSLRLSWLDRKSARGADRFRGVQSIDSPIGRFSYGYGSASPAGTTVEARALFSNLVSVSYPPIADSRRERRYHYEDKLHPTLMTGISIDSRDSSNKLTSVRYASYAYRADGKAAMSMHAGNVNKVTLDFSRPNQTTLTNSLGQTTVYHYATSGDEYRLLEVRGQGCSTCGEANRRYRYDKLGRMTEAIKLSPLGAPLEGTRHELDMHGRPVKVSKVAYRNGKPLASAWQVRYEYHSAASRAPSLIVKPSVVPGKEALTRYTYNREGQTLSMTESGWSPPISAQQEPSAITRTVSYTYSRINGRSVLVQVDGPLANGKLNSPVDSDLVRLEYDARGSFVTREHKPGNIVREVLARDAAMRPTSVRQSDGLRVLESALSYDAAGQTTSIIQRGAMANAAPTLSRTTTFAYDLGGRLATVTRPDRTTMRIEYDAAGRHGALIDAAGNRMSSRFDSEGKLIAVVTTDTAGAVLNGVLKLWDEHQQLRASYTPAGLAHAVGRTPDSATKVVFDGNGEAAAVATKGNDVFFLNKDESTAQLTVSRAGVLRTDGAGRRHAFVNDDFGRIVLERAPDEGTMTFRYDERVFEKTHTARDGERKVVERHEYAANGLLTKRMVAGCAESLSYGGNLLMRLDGCGNAHSYVRDAFGQIVEHTLTVAVEGSSRSLSFSTRYVYDAATGQMTARRLPDGQLLAYRYDKVSGNSTGISRDSGWLAWIDVRIGRPVADALRTMLPAGMTEDAIISDVEWRPFGGLRAVKSGNGVVSKNSFDTSGRLAGLDVSAPAKEPIETAHYRYDGADNIIAITRGLNKTVYDYDGAGRLVGEQASTMTAAPLATASIEDALKYGYDLLGRRTVASARPELDTFGRQIRREGQELTYDDAHRLKSVTKNGQELARYRYDVLGNRVAKTVGARTTYYLYNNARQLVGEADQDGNMTTQYLYAALRPVALMRADGARQTRALYAVHADHRGLPLSVTDAKQQVVWRGQFDAFGNQAGTAESMVAQEPGFGLFSPANAAKAPEFEMHLRMAGQYEDAETGLHYNIHRYYDPRHGRYITPDPTGLAGGEYAYLYAGGDPVGSIDPLGLWKIPPPSAIFEDPFNTFWDVMEPDTGHGDITRIAFAQYQRAKSARFSAHTIEWVVRNNYHTDANGPTCLTGALGPIQSPLPTDDGAGQCNLLNHFDNPNDGPMYTEKVDLNNPTASRKLTKTYKDTKGDDWIADSVKQINDNRARYGTVENGHDISRILSAFGQNLHAIQDFYSHSNWTGSQDRGGNVVTTRKFFFGDTKVECGWIPPGLNQSRLWDMEKDGIGYAHLFTGTVQGPGAANVYCGHHSFGTEYGDLECDEDESTHGYWNYDARGPKNNERVYTGTETKSFNERNLYYWEAQEYDMDRSPTGTFGIEWYGDFGKIEKNFKKGDAVYVRKSITDHHEMGQALAILHTQSEIDRLVKKSAGARVGDNWLKDIYNMDKDQKESKYNRADRVIYDTKHSKLLKSRK